MIRVIIIWLEWRGLSGSVKLCESVRWGKKEN